MKIDMERAWSAGLAMIGANRQMVMIVAGVFFFLPYLALTLLIPQVPQMQVKILENPADLQAAFDSVASYYASYWWAFLAVAIAQIIGTIALLVLLTDKSRPTVGDALARGASGLPSYVGAQLLYALALALLVVVPAVLVAGTGSRGLFVLAVLLAIIVAVYFGIRFVLTGPAIAIDRLRNPVAVLARSWQLTRGNSLRLLMFFLLLGIAIGIVALLITMVFGVAFAAIGGEVETMGNGVVASLISAVSTAIFLAVQAAVHRQLVSGCD